MISSPSRPPGGPAVTVAGTGCSRGAGGPEPNWQSQNHDHDARGGPFPRHLQCQPQAASGPPLASPAVTVPEWPGPGRGRAGLGQAQPATVTRRTAGTGLRVSLGPVGRRDTGDCIQ